LKASLAALRDSRTGGEMQLLHPMVWMACSVSWAGVSAANGVVAVTQGKRCDFLVETATSGASVSASASELRESEVSCIAELSGSAGQEASGAASAESIYTALLWLCNREPAATEEHIAALVGPLGAHDDNTAVPFYHGLARRRGAGAVAEAGWRQGLAIAHSEVLAARTPGVFRRGPCGTA
jgi:hypothetical protein